MEEKDSSTVDPLEEIELDEPERFTYVNSLVSSKEREQVRLTLLSSIDVFSWRHSNIVGINPTVASHKLIVLPTSKLVRQKVGRFHPKRHQIIHTEVDNLLAASFIREVQYPKWLVNVVLISKKGGKWCVCVDYTDLNEACPKDSFPLSHIDQIMDATVGHGILSFLDAFSRYHQTLMHLPDVEKTTFITPHRLYYYNVMSFGLKNAGATYQRMESKIFRPLIDTSMEVYIDDMLIKSKERPDHTRHLQETFKLLRRHNMKLNPLKCAFNVISGRFPSFMVMQRRIEANPIQLKAIMNSHTPTSKKGVQQLTDRLAALRRFISRFIDRLKLFFATLKGAQGAV